jgi:hypothetical protein
MAEVEQPAALSERPSASASFTRRVWCVAANVRPRMFSKMRQANEPVRMARARPRPFSSLASARAEHATKF